MKPLVSFVVALLLAVTGCTTVNVTPSGEAGGAAKSSTAGADNGKAKDDKKSPFKDWKEVLKDTKAVDGFFRTHLKRDNTLYLEIRPDQLEQEFGMVLHLSKGIGAFFIVDGLALTNSRIMRFERKGDKIYLVHVNHRFIAPGDAPSEASVSENVANSIVSAFEIASEDSSSKALLVDATGFFVSDYADMADWLKGSYGQKPVSFDKDRSYVDRVQGYPKNLEVDALLTYKSGDAPQRSSVGISDYRSVPLGIRYSIFELPEDLMASRMGDDRIGYFMDVARDFSRYEDYDQFETRINRWRLEKKDDSQEVSEPVKPIVFYVDRTVPEKLRPFVKEGIEAWNRGFEAAGFRNAIVAKDAPADSSWNPEDIRYSTVRWIASNGMGSSAIGPSQTDPRTGEILNADVLISSDYVRWFAVEYQNNVDPIGAIETFRRMDDFSALLPPVMRDRLCFAGIGMQQQLAVQFAALLAADVISGAGEIPIEYIGEALRNLVMHEIGHTLGLRHNFKASAAIPTDRLHDKSFTEKHGVMASVMDYDAVNLSLDRSKQGHYYNIGLGDYDVWAIQYGYSPIYQQPAEGPLVASGIPVTSSEQERVGLEKIAGRSAEPLLVYNTDYDILGRDSWGEYTVDPQTSRWDLGADPLAFARSREELVTYVRPRLEPRLILTGDSYDRLRSAVGRLTSERLLAARAVVNTIGGLHFSRDHKASQNARVPFRVVEAERQREALEFLAQNVFSADAFHLDQDLLNRMPPSRLVHWGTGVARPIDYPIHSVAASGQEWILSSLLDNVRLTRMIDNEVRAEGEAFTVAELLQTLTRDIWTEIANPARPGTGNSFRRNLQRIYLDRLVSIVLDLRPTPGARPAPEDARSLARLELIELSERIETSLESPALDRTMRAHLAESNARIDKALDASVTIDLD